MVERYNKLVRDKIPEIILEEGKAVKCKYVIDNDDELTRLFKEKIVEECEELFAVLYSEDKKSILDELADIYEVLDSLVKHLDIPGTLLEEAMVTKAELRGSFDKHVYLMEVEDC